MDNLRLRFLGSNDTSYSHNTKNYDELLFCHSYTKDRLTIKVSNFQVFHKRTNGAP